MNTPITDLKTRLNKAMVLRNMKAVELVEKTKISKSAISHYMSGYAEPKTDRTYIIAKVLNVNPVWLMGYDVPIEVETVETVKDKDYYLDSEAFELITFLKENPDYKAVVDAARNVSKEDLEVVKRIIDGLKK